MTETLAALCGRPLAGSQRVELFARLLEAILRTRRLGTAPPIPSPEQITVADGVDLGSAASGATSSDTVAELLACVERIFPTSTVDEPVLVNHPAVPWVVDHVVGSLRRGRLPPLSAVLQALQPYRRSLALDDDGLASARREDADALIAEATRLATRHGPGDAVLWALDRACRADPEHVEAPARRARVAEACGRDPAALRREVVEAARAVLAHRDPVAAARLASFLSGPGAPTDPILDPLGEATVERIRSVPKAAQATIAVALVGAALIGGAAWRAAWRSAEERVDVPAPRVARPPSPSSQVPPRPTTSTSSPRVPLPGPAIVNVWLEGCADCMPTFEAWRRLVEQRALPGDAPVYNIAYGTERETTQAFARRYRVDESLHFDIDGGLIVRPLGIGTFTTFVFDGEGRIVYRGRAVDDGFAAHVARAWADVRSRHPSKRLAPPASPASTSRTNQGPP